MGAWIGRLALAAAWVACLGVAEGRGGPIVVLGNDLRAGDGTLSAVASVGGVYSKAIGFTMSGQSLALDTITLRLREQAGSSSTLTVALYGGGNGPSGPALVTFATPAIPNVAGNVAFRPSSGFVLQANSTYWLDVSGTSDTLNGIVWYASAGGASPSGVATLAGQRDINPRASLAATTASTVVNAFQITALAGPEAVPEPAGWIQGVLALAAGLGCAAGSRWRGGKTVRA